MKIKTALTIISTFALIVFIALSASLVHFSGLLTDTADRLAEAGESIFLNSELKERLLVHNRNSFLYSLTRDPERLKSRVQKRKEILYLMANMRQHAHRIEDRKALDNVSIEISEYFKMRDELDASSLSSTEQYDQISASVDRTINAIEILGAQNRIYMQKLSSEIQQQNNLADQLAFLLLVIGSIIVSVAIFSAAKTIGQPLAALSQIVARYGKGNSSLRAPIKGLVEMREIASQFNRMAERLEERRKDQLRFISSVAHDLRNPLGSISMAAELLTEKKSNQELDLLKIISRQSRHLERLLSDLLDTTRIEGGQLLLECSNQDVRKPIQDVLDLHRNSSKLHHFKLSLPEKPLFCFYDNSRLSQVLNNLISNAIKYSPHGGVIKVKAWTTTNLIKIAISDQGIGINPEEFEKIFMPFHRSSATKTTIPGIGLGLSASKKIIEAHGGSIKVKSSPGKGSVFYVILPAKTEKPPVFKNPLKRPTALDHSSELH